MSPSFIEITVVGEVKSPGTKQIYSGGSLVDAIMIAGGPKDWEAINKILSYSGRMMMEK